MNPSPTVTYRIDRYDPASKQWSIARSGLLTLEAGKAELAAMKEENPNSKLRLVQIESRVLQEL